MRSKLASVALIGALGITGVAGTALVVPAVSYAATGDSTALTSRVDTLKQALAGLVTDGTITQSQADKVASTLAESPAAHGHRGGRMSAQMTLGAAAEALGLTQAELRTQLQAGKTLADLAEVEGVDQDVLVKALVDAAKTRLAAAVEAGRLTQAEADEKSGELTARITDSLDEVRKPGSGGHGHRGAGLRGDA